MARKPSLEKRTNKPQICFTDSELEIAERNARQARMTFSEWGRYRMAEVQPKRLKPTEAEEAQIRAAADLQYIRKALEELKQKVSDDILQEFRDAAQEAVENFKKAKQ